LHFQSAPLGERQGVSPPSSHAQPATLPIILPARTTEPDRKQKRRNRTRMAHAIPLAEGISSNATHHVSTIGLMQITSGNS
jgi:hypothetical protein